MGGEGGAIGTAAANHLWARALIHALHAGGLRRVCVSPGSRSTPLVWAAREQPGIEICVQIDERSSAFLALGIAKGSGAPVAAICTSGTAAANYLPAVIEASLASVPILLLTADRPPEARGTGAPQTCDQVALYGPHVRLFRDLPCPDGGIDPPEAEEMLRSAARFAREALSAACGTPCGPVHLNVPFREPLVPTPREIERIDEIWRERAIGPSIEPPVEPSVAPSLPSGIGALIERIAWARRPLILAGPEAVSPDAAGPVIELARAAKVPIIADVASGIRFAPEAEGVLLLSHADLFLRDPDVASQSPDLVLRLGGIPISKTVAGYLARHRPHLVAIQSDGRRRDPDGIVNETIVGSAARICEILRTRCRGGERDDAWHRLLRKAEERAEHLSARAPLEAAAVREGCAAIPPGTALFLSNSMPIRWGDAYAAPSGTGARVFVNRGVNGIDGIISTALGVSIGSDAPLLLAIGDLALLHDLGGLRAAGSITRPVAILLLHNDGGGIFSHLPVAAHPEILDPLFATPHGADLSSAVRAFGVPHVRVESAGEAAARIRESLAPGAAGVRVIEVRTDRKKTAMEHARLVETIATHPASVWADDLLWQIRETGAEDAPAVVLLHGFSGTGRFWNSVARRLPGFHCLYPDLPGHGGTGAPLPPEAWRMERAAEALIRLLDRTRIPRCGLVGYSMGGRLALHAALRFPERISHLVLFGASAGIASAEERISRAREDDELAESIVRDGIATFAERWEGQPMFESQRRLPPWTLESMREDRRAQDPARLAAALRAFGTGFQSPLHDRLAELRMPTLIVAGEDDAKYAKIAREMTAMIPGAVCRIVPGAGHAVPLEHPEACAAWIDRFLKGAEIG